MKTICATCGTTKQNKNNGYCANGHDNWLELEAFERTQLRNLYKADKDKFRKYLRLPNL